MGWLSRHLRKKAVRTVPLGLENLTQAQWDSFLLGNAIDVDGYSLFLRRQSNVWTLVYKNVDPLHWGDSAQMYLVSHERTTIAATRLLGAWFAHRAKIVARKKVSGGCLEVRRIAR